MRIVLQNRYHLVNGTQTMILRMARALREKGHDPMFVRFNEQPVALLDEIGQYARIVHIRDFLAVDSVARVGRIDAIYCYTEDTFVRTLYAGAIPCKKIIVGVFHPRQYQIKVRFTESYLVRLYKRLLFALPERNLIFMNPECRDSCERFFGRSLANANILPIPVNVPSNLPERSAVNRYKIVSIGRLVEFKNYHLPVIEFVIRQRALGHPFEYHIYGEGPLRDELAELIRGKQAGDWVRLQGTLPYSELGPAIKDAGAAIGMGTAMVEAAAAGIPAIFAVDMQRLNCYGWFHETKGYCLGELNDRMPQRPIGEVLLEYQAWSSDAYDQATQKSWERARDFSTSRVVDEFLEIVQRAENFEGALVTRWEWLRFWAAKAYARYFLEPGWKHR